MQQSYYMNDLLFQIQFQSISDALIAGLWLKHKLSWDSIDLFLSILRDPGFDINQLTIKRAADVDRMISEQRLDVASRRQYPGSLTTTNGANKVVGLPLIIIDFVADLLEDEISDLAMQEFIGSGDAFDSEHSRDVVVRPQNALRSMSLVCRSWTPCAQKALRRCIYLQEDSIMNFHRSPACGFSVKTINFSQSVLSDSELPALVSIITRCPNLRHFKLKTRHSQIRRILSALSCAKFLTSLYITRRDARPSNYLHDFLAILPRFKALECLSIHHWAPHWQDQGQSQDSLFKGIAPPPSLKYLSLRDTSSRTNDSTLLWLLQSRNGYILKNLKIHTWRGDTLLKQIARLSQTDYRFRQTTLSQLEKLWLSTTSRFKPRSGSDALKCDVIFDFQDVLSSCNSLRVMFLDCLDVRLALPPSLAGNIVPYFPREDRFRAGAKIRGEFVKQHAFFDGVTFEGFGSTGEQPVSGWRRRRSC